LANNPPEVIWNDFQAEGHVLGTDAQPGLDTLQAALRDVQGPEALLGEHRSTTVTDTRFYGLYYGIPAFCFGPRADQIHGFDERVDLALTAK